MRGVIDSKKLENIAEAIRNRAGTKKTYSPEKMPEGITEVYNKGIDEGYIDGYDQGYKHGEVNGSGKAESDFWDNLLNFGNRGRACGMFDNWQGEYIRPTTKPAEGKSKPIQPTAFTPNYGLFRFATSSKVKKIEKAYIDFSGLGLPTDSSNIGYRQAFQSCEQLEEVEDIGMQPACYYYTFHGCDKLHTIEVLRFAEDTRETSGFALCSSLKNITVEGTIGRSVSFKSSPLTLTSAISIIEHLKDYNGVSGDPYTLTLSTTTKGYLSSEGDEATSYKGQPCSWAQLIAYKRWNLA